MPISELTEAMVGDAAKLAEKLDSQGKPPKVVAWSLNNSDFWELVIASTTYDSVLGQQPGLSSLKEAIDDIGITSFEFVDCSVVDTKSRFCAAIGIYRTGEEITPNLTITNDTVDGFILRNIRLLRSH